MLKLNGIVEVTGWVRAAAHAAAVDDFAAVRHAVAAGAGGVVAPAHAARVNDLPTFRDSITPSAGGVVATAHATSVQLLATVGHTIATCTRATIASAHTATIDNFIRNGKIQRSADSHCCSVTQNVLHYNQSCSEGQAQRRWGDVCTAVGDDRSSVERAGGWHVQGQIPGSCEENNSRTPTCTDDVRA